MPGTTTVIEPTVDTLQDGKGGPLIALVGVHRGLDSVLDL